MAFPGLTKKSFAPGGRGWITGRIQAGDCDFFAVFCFAHLQRIDVWPMYEGMFAVISDRKIEGTCLPRGDV